MKKPSEAELADRVRELQDRIDQLLREHTDAVVAYQRCRLDAIRAGEQVSESSPLTGQARDDQFRREDVARHNSEQDRQARSKGLIGDD